MLGLGPQVSFNPHIPPLVDHLSTWWYIPLDVIIILQEPETFCKLPRSSKCRISFSTMRFLRVCLWNGQFPKRRNREFNSNYGILFVPSYLCIDLGRFFLHCYSELCKFSIIIKGTMTWIKIVSMFIMPLFIFRNYSLLARETWTRPIEFL